MAKTTITHGGARGRRFATFTESGVARTAVVGSATQTEPLIVTQSYSNFGGTGDRRGLITLTSTFPNDAYFGNSRKLDGLINGGGLSLGYFMNTGESVAGHSIRFDFLCAPRIIDKVKLYAGSTSSTDVYQFQGFDGSSWTNLGSTFAMSSISSGGTEINLSNTTAYYAYRLLGVSGTSGNENLYVEFSIDNTVSAGYIVASIGATASRGNATTWTTAGITTTSDAWLVAMFWGENGTAFTISSVTDSDGLTWTKQSSFTSTDTNAHNDVEIWYARRPTGSSGTVTFNFTAGVDDAAYQIIAVANLPNMSSLFKSGASATYHNDTNTAAVPSLSLTHSGLGLVLNIGGASVNSRPNADFGYSEGQGIADYSETGGGNWALTNFSAFRTYAPSGYSVAWRGSVPNYAVLADVIDLGSFTPATPTGTWASTEAKDVFTGLGGTNDAGEWHSTEAADTFAAAGYLPIHGTLAATDTKDTFAATIFLPPTGTLSITEHGDSWATSGGFEALGIEDITPDSSLGEGGGFTVTTNGPDRIIIYLFASIGNNQRYASVASIDGPLTWHTEAFGFGILPGGEFADGVSIQLCWAYAHDKLTAQTFNVTTDGVAVTFLGVHCAIKGLNGNYNAPWEPIGPGLGPCIAFDSFNDTNTPKFPSLSPFGTGENATASEPYPGVVFACAMATPGGGGFIEFGPPFPQIAHKDKVGSVRDGQISLAALVTSYSIPWQLSDSTDSGVQYMEEHTGFLAFTDALRAIAPPNRWVSQEGADGFHAFGYVGSTPGPIGYMDAHEAKDTFAAVGYQPVSGVWHSTEAKDTFSAFIKVPITGTLNVTEAKDRFTGHGIGLGEDGVLITTESVDMFNATGYTPVSGTFNATETTDRARFVGPDVVSQRKRRNFYVT